MFSQNPSPLDQRLGEGRKVIVSQNHIGNMAYDLCAVGAIATPTSASGARAHR
jgi:hypothetical protein